MSIDQLRRLVRQYVAAQVAYDVFRLRFVSDFLSVHHADALLNRLSNSIESSCADFSADLLDELSLKARLASLALAQPAGFRQTSSAGNLIDIVLDNPRLVVEVLSQASNIGVHSTAIHGSFNSPVITKTNVRVVEPAA